MTKSLGSGEPEPSWQRAALSFLAGMAALGSGAAAGAGMSRRQRSTPRPRPAPTRGERIEANLAILTCYATIIGGGLLGWQLAHSVIGVFIGTIVGAGMALVGALVVAGIGALVKVIRR